MTFRIVFMVRDKDLPNCLHAVKGFALNMEVPQPVVHVGTEDQGTTPELVARELIKVRADAEITSQDVSVIIQGLGRAPKSYSSVMTTLVNAGFLKRIRKGVYKRSGKLPKQAPRKTRK